MKVKNRRSNICTQIRESLEAVGMTAEWSLDGELALYVTFSVEKVTLTLRFYFATRLLRKPVLKIYLTTEAFTAWKKHIERMEAVLTSDGLISHIEVVLWRGKHSTWDGGAG